MKYKKFVVLLVFVLFVFITSCSNTCKDENVTMLLNGTGYFQTEPVKTEPKIKWKYQIGDASDPIGGATVKNDVLFFSDYSSIYAVNANTGKEKWKFNGVSSYLEPIVANGIVYYGSSNKFYAIDAKTGQEKWNFKLNEGDGHISTAAAVACNSVFFGTFKGYLYALNTKDGNFKWKFKVDERNYFQALINGAPLVKNNLVYFTGSRNLYAVNIKDGKLNWKTNMSADILVEYNGYNNIFPVLDDKNIYLGNSEGNFFAIDLKTGLKKWKYKAEGVITSPAIADGIVYFVSCKSSNVNKTFLYALDAETGEKIWKLSYNTGCDSDEYYHLPPTVAEGVVYFTHRPSKINNNSDYSIVYGITFIEAIDAKTGKKLWRKSLGKVAINMPYILVNKGVIYIGIDGKIYALQ